LLFCLGFPGLFWIRVGRMGTLVSFLIKYDVGYIFVIYSLYNVEVHYFYS
jgi:hypothetical protein